MVGTTVCDDGLLERAFSEAVADLGLTAGTPEFDRALAQMRATVSESKVVVFRALLGGDERRAAQVNDVFERAYGRIAASGGVHSVPGAETALRSLRDAGVSVCLVTGFGRVTQDALLAALGWTELVDLALVADEAGRGRPFPDLVLTAVLRLGIDDVRSVAVVGDTHSDVLGGVRAGAPVAAGVLTGVHDRATLLAAGATHVLDSVADLPAVVLGESPDCSGPSGSVSPGIRPVRTGWL